MENLPEPGEGVSVFLHFYIFGQIAADGGILLANCLEGDAGAANAPKRNVIPVKDWEDRPEHLFQSIVGRRNEQNALFLEKIG